MKYLGIFIIFIFSFSPVNAKDLIGNALECTAENGYTGKRELFAIEFTSKKKARYSMVQTENSMNTDGKDVVYSLIKNEIVEYDVKDEFILVRNQHLKGFFNNDHTEINRRTLQLNNDPPEDAGHVWDREGQGGCKLIDIKSYDPFKTINELELTPPKPKKEKKL